jgi:hypothetical protein
VLKPLARIGMPLAILLGVAVFPVVRWMLDGESSLLDLRLVFAVTLLASWLRILSGLKDAPLRPHTLGLLHSGWWFDEFIPARRVVSVVAGKDSVVLRLDDPEDALALPATCIASHATWLSEPAHADRSAATIRTWLAQATPSAATGWRRPSMTLIPGAIALIGFLLAWGWPRFTG